MCYFKLFGDNVFNCVFAYENAKNLLKTISENPEDTKDVANEKYHILIDKLNSFKQLDHENAETMYSRLNILVNEINSLDVKKIDVAVGNERLQNYSIV